MKPLGSWSFNNHHGIIVRVESWLGSYEVMRRKSQNTLMTRNECLP